jgi:transcriptional regulator with XRE-family HTH domain
MGDVARRVRARRLELGLSVAETARRSGVSRAYITKIENAETDGAISGNVLFELSRVLGTTPAHILGRVEDDGPLPPPLRDYVKEPKADPRLLAAMGLLHFRGDEHELTRDDWIVIARSLVELMARPAETSSQRHLATTIAAGLVDRALGEFARERNIRMVEKLMRLAARDIRQVSEQIAQRQQVGDGDGSEEIDFGEGDDQGSEDFNGARPDA